MELRINPYNFYELIVSIVTISYESSTVQFLEIIGKRIPQLHIRGKKF